MKVLLDINVILDVLQAREPHYQSSAKVLSLCAESLQGHISAISYGTLHYILSKELGKHQTINTLKKIRTITRVAPVDGKIIDLALSSNFDDFEDALQYYCAIRRKITHIITRNKRDFLKAKIVVANPEEFLTMVAN